MQCAVVSLLCVRVVCSWTLAHCSALRALSLAHTETHDSERMKNYMPVSERSFWLRRTRWRPWVPPEPIRKVSRHSHGFRRHKTDVCTGRQYRQI